MPVELCELFLHMLSRTRLATLAVLVLFLVVLLLLASKALQHPWLDPETLAIRVEAASPLVIGTWIISAVLFTSAGLPRQLVAFVCGYLYGVFSGLVLSLAIAIVGCALAFYAARYWLRNVVAVRFPSMLRLLDSFVAEDVFGKILVLRLQPLGTNLITNLCAGVSEIRAVPFLASSALGYIPQMLVFALAGSGLRLGSTTQLFVSLGLLLVSLVLGWYLFRRHRQRTGAA